MTVIVFNQAAFRLIVQNKAELRRAARAAYGVEWKKARAIERRT